MVSLFSLLFLLAFVTLLFALYQRRQATLARRLERRWIREARAAHRQAHYDAKWARWN